MRHSLALLMAAVLLVACGSSDEESSATNDDISTVDDAAPGANASGVGSGDADDAGGSNDNNSSTDSGNDFGLDSGNDAGNDDDDTIQVNSIDDLPRKCVELFSEFLREIESVVSDIDWSNATIKDFEDLDIDLEPANDEFDIRSQAEGCDNYEFGDDESFDFFIEIARREAPGTVGYFEFLQDLLGGSGILDGGDSGSTTGGNDAPTNCDDAIGAIEDLLDEYSSIADVPVSEASKVSAVVTVCSPAQIQTFFDRPDVDVFLSGG